MHFLKKKRFFKYFLFVMFIYVKNNKYFHVFFFLNFLNLLFFEVKNCSFLYIMCIFLLYCYYIIMYDNIFWFNNSRSAIYIHEQIHCRITLGINYSIRLIYLNQTHENNILYIIISYSF